MNAERTVCPTSSYHLQLPRDICEQFDKTVSSFWLKGNPLLLQLSSYLRDDEKQIGALDRLRERIARNDQNWNIWRNRIHPATIVDQATAEYRAGDDCVWVHSYIVWPHLTIYATVSGPEALVRDKNNWAFRAIKSLAITTH